MTQDSETRLRELLSTVHPPASTMTATSLVREGRRTRRRRRQWLVTGAAGLATLGLASAAGVAGLVDRKAPAGPEVPRQVGTSATPAVIELNCSIMLSAVASEKLFGLPKDTFRRTRSMSSIWSLA